MTTVADHFPAWWADPCTADQHLALVRDAVACHADHLAIYVLRDLLDARSRDGKPDYRTRLVAAGVAREYGLEDLL